MLYCSNPQDVYKRQEQYNSVEECPAWARPTIEKLVQKGYLQGDEDGNLELSFDLMRNLVINDRVHLYG